MPKKTTRKHRAAVPHIDAEFQSRRKTLPEITNLQLTVDMIEYVSTGAVLLHLTVATINGERTSAWPTQFKASLLLDQHRLAQIISNRDVSPAERDRVASGIAAQLTLDKAKQLARAAQEASVVASQAALTVGVAARRVAQALGATGLESIDLGMPQDK
jgi:multidrug efflux pump subunit AcrA (membrane-fusion protein)